MSNPVTPERFDAVIAAAPRADRERAERIIWTLSAIGRHIGVGPDFVRDTLAKLPGSPIRQAGCRYYAFEDELTAFMRGRRG